MRCQLKIKTMYDSIERKAILKAYYVNKAHLNCNGNNTPLAATFLENVIQVVLLKLGNDSTNDFIVFFLFHTNNY